MKKSRRNSYCTLTANLSDVMVDDVVVTEAVMLAVPIVTPVTRPVLLTVAIFVESDVHVTWFVTSLLVPSAKLAFAVSCTVAPVLIVDVVPVTVIVLIAEALTITPAFASTPSCDAVIVVVPDATAVTRPALTVANEGAELLHLAVLVTS